MRKLILFFSNSIITLSFVLENPVLINDSKRMDGNNIGGWFSNNGIYNSNPNIGNYGGFEWPIGTNKRARYTSGIWIIARSGNDTVAAIANYTSEFLPGFIDNNGIPQGKDDPNFKIYKIVEGDSLSNDYINWPISQGAYTNQMGKPLLLGNQTIFYSFTDGYPEAHTHLSGSTLPMKVQILQTNWCYNDTPELNNIIFSEYRIINRSNQVWENTFISVYTDESISGNIKLGCDTLENLFFKYSRFENMYNFPRPAVGTRLLKGPITYTGNNIDTVKFCDLKSMRIREKIGYKEMKFTSYNFTQNADPHTGDPVNYNQTYLYVQGIKKTGLPWINPITNQITKYPYSGDPYSGTGMLNEYHGNFRHVFNSGPVNILPNDTQFITIAQVIAQGQNDTHSVQVLREYSRVAQYFYDNCFTQIPIGINQIATTIPENFFLSQNYPNPFNPTTNIRFRIPESGFVMLKVFDITGREVATLVNEQMNAGEFNYQFSTDEYQLGSGVYFYRLIVKGKNGGMDFSQTKKMVLVR